MRKQLLGVFLPLLVLVLMAAGETQSTGTESASHAMLQKVNVLHGENGISVEITGRGQLKPELSMVDSPARLVVDLPATAMATSQSRIGVDSDGVKGVRIGMDGKTPPTTSVVVDLEQACAYELTPGASGKFVLTLHTQSVAKNAPAAAPGKAPTPAAKPQTAAAKPVIAPASAAPKVAAAVKAAAPAPRMTHVDLRRGKALKSLAVSKTSALIPVCAGSGGLAAGCCERSRLPVSCWAAAGAAAPISAMKRTIDATAARRAFGMVTSRLSRTDDDASMTSR